MHSISKHIRYNELEERGDSCSLRFPEVDFRKYRTKNR